MCVRPDALVKYRRDSRLACGIARVFKKNQFHAEVSLMNHEHTVHEPLTDAVRRNTHCVFTEGAAQLIILHIPRGLC